MTERTGLSRAIRLGDYEAILDILWTKTDRTPDGCWVWRGKRNRSGYATIKVSKRTVQVHRAALEARLGQRLGSQHSHHMCANPSCVNPDHLQPVTAAANSAEMMARTYMVARITELEAALRVLDPSHHLLDEVSVSLV